MSFIQRPIVEAGAARESFRLWLALSIALTATFTLCDWIVLDHVRPVYLLSLGMLCALGWVVSARALVQFERLSSNMNPLSVTGFAFHLTAALLFSLACTAGFAFVMWAGDRFWWNRGGTFGRMFRSSTFYFLLANTVYYGFVIASQRSAAQKNELNELRVREARTSQQLVMARMEMMRIQMQPHFLFNSLNSISSLIRLKEHGQAVATIEKLGAVLRSTLSQNDQAFTSLSCELDHVQEYLELETIRFGDRLRFTTDLGDGVRDLIVPRWILQPLVENAIHHGIEKQIDATEIRLTAHRAGDQLKIQICDDGPGVADGYEEGVGLGNTRKRLYELFSGEAELLLDSSVNGTCQQLSLPVQEAME